MAFAFCFRSRLAKPEHDGWLCRRRGQDTLTETSDALGDDLWAMLKADSNEAINQTINTQPLMLAAGVAAFRAWLAAGGAPSVVASHNLGEYSALVAADALDFDDAVRLVRLRAEGHAIGCAGWRRRHGRRAGPGRRRHRRRLRRSRAGQKWSGGELQRPWPGGDCRRQGGG